MNPKPKKGSRKLSCLFTWGWVSRMLVCRGKKIGQDCLRASCKGQVKNYHFWWIFVNSEVFCTESVLADYKSSCLIGFKRLSSLNLSFPLAQCLEQKLYILTMQIIILKRSLIPMSVTSATLPPLTTNELHNSKSYIMYKIM